MLTSVMKWPLTYLFGVSSKFWVRVCVDLKSVVMQIKEGLQISNCQPDICFFIKKCHNSVCCN